MWNATFDETSAVFRVLAFIKIVHIVRMGYVRCFDHNRRTLGCRLGSLFLFENYPENSLLGLAVPTISVTAHEFSI